MGVEVCSLVDIGGLLEMNLLLIHLTVVDSVLSVLAGAVDTLFAACLGLVIIFLVLRIYLIALLFDIAFPANV